MLNILTILAAANQCSDTNFFGLKPWWNYLPQSDFSGDCKDIVHFNLLHGSEIPLVLLAVVDDLLRIVGLLAVAFVLYGGVQFITSQGNPEAASKARSTIINALLGLALAMVAVAFVSYLGNKLGG